MEPDLATIPDRDQRLADLAYWFGTPIQVWRRMDDDIVIKAWTLGYERWGSGCEQPSSPVSQAKTADT